MSHYTREMSIQAPAATVFAALTTPQGLRSWWTNTCEVGVTPGATSSFRFDRSHKLMQILELSPNARVRWKCIDSHIDVNELADKNEWAGTTIVFHLTEIAGETTLRFEHVGLTAGLECFTLCERGWNRFLESLKSYCETGTGEPYISREPAALGDYMLLFRGNDWQPKLSQEQMERVISDWAAWFEGLMREGKCVDGQPLQKRGKVVSGKNGSVISDGPFAESKEVIGGYFHLQSVTEEEAVAIAQQCPGLEFGSAVEVRPFAPRCTETAKNFKRREVGAGSLEGAG